MQPTKEQLNAEFQIVLAIADASRELKEVPAGHIYNSNELSFLKSNARLFAAAPELLAALQECADALADHIELESHRTGATPEVVCPCKTITLAKARAALAKAEGK